MPPVIDILVAFGLSLVIRHGEAVEEGVRQLVRAGVNLDPFEPRLLIAKLLEGVRVDFLQKPGRSHIYTKPKAPRGGHHL